MTCDMYVVHSIAEYNVSLLSQRTFTVCQVGVCGVVLSKRVGSYVLITPFDCS